MKRQKTTSLFFVSLIFYFFVDCYLKPLSESLWNQLESEKKENKNFRQYTATISVQLGTQAEDLVDDIHHWGKILDRNGNRLGRKAGLHCTMSNWQGPEKGFCLGEEFGSFQS